MYGPRWGVNQQWPSTQITLFERKRHSAWLVVETTTADKKRVNSCALKQLIFWGSSATKKIAQNPRKCSLRCANNVTFSNFRGWHRKKKPRSARFFKTVLRVCAVLIKVVLGIFDFCAISRRLISKDSISSPNFSCGCSYAERALWCQDSKRRALANCFSVRICYEFLISKCRRDWNLGLYTFCVLALINPLSDGKIRFFLRAKCVFFRKSLLLSVFLFASTQKVHRPRSKSPLQSDIRNL